MDRGPLSRCSETYKPAKHIPQSARKFHTQRERVRPVRGPETIKQNYPAPVILQSKGRNCFDPRPVCCRPALRYRKGPVQANGKSGTHGQAAGEEHKQISRES